MKKQENTYKFMQASNPDEARDAWKQERLTLQVAIDKATREWQKLRATKPLSARELDEKIAQLREELLLLDEAYKEYSRGILVEEYNNKTEILGALRNEIKDYDERIIAALLGAFRMMETRVEANQKLVKVQSRIAGTSKKFGLPEIAKAEMTTAWKQPIKGATGEMIKHGYMMYARRVADNPASAQSLAEFTAIKKR